MKHDRQAGITAYFVDGHVFLRMVDHERGIGLEHKLPLTSWEMLVAQVEADREAEAAFAKGIGAIENDMR